MHSGFSLLFPFSYFLSSFNVLSFYVVDIEMIVLANIGIFHTIFVSDMLLPNKILNLTSTNQNKSLMILALEDDVALEGEETVILTLTGPDSVTILNGRFEITIIDTDGRRY